MPARAWMLLAVTAWAVASTAVFAAVAEHRRAERLAAFAGLTGVRGRGVEILLVDARSPSRAPRNEALVTDGDLIFLNMLLWYGGTRAVAINDERVTAQTSITSSGPVILINGRRIAAPFRITAIGDPGTLRAVLTQGGLLEQMRRAGITARISERAALEVPAWRPPANPAAGLSD
jgi:uncharacterized protein YlxW (UPF0749 family)